MNLPSVTYSEHEQKTMKINKKYLYFTIGILAILVVWSIISLIVNSKFLIPTPWDTAVEFFNLLKTSEFYTALGATALRSLIGFLIAVVVGLVLSILAYRYKALEKVFSPFMTVMRATPTMSFIFLLVVWFSPTVSPAFIGFVVVFPILYENFHTALNGVDKKLIEMSKVFRVDKATQIKTLYIPQSLPTMLAGVKSGISLNVKIVISAEVLASTAKSIGTQMQIAIQNTVATLFAWTIWAIILAFVFEGIVALLANLTLGKRLKQNRKTENTI